MSGTILLIEDEELVGTMVRMNLENSEFEVEWCKDGKQAVEKVGSAQFDAILLDIGLPGLDGMEILAEIRRRGIGTPVMMLTARGDVQSKVQALELGADDYLPKPFDVAELIARVKALVRRSQSDREIPSESIVKFSKYEINLETREAVTNQGEVVLSEKECAIMGLLVRARGQVLSRSDILEEVWGMDATPSERTVDNFIVQLRKLFEPQIEKPRHFITVRGIGYRFVP
jgi:two-component system alkaline phosphatase synthesis response regulator PhoP